MTIAVTYTFSNGTTSSATEVNTNFQDLIDAMTDGTETFSVGAMTVAGSATFNGNTTIGNASGDDLTINASLASSIVIKTANTYGIGAAGTGLTGIYFQSSASNTTRLIFGSGVANITYTLPGTAGTAGYGLINTGSSTFAYTPMQTDINAVSSADYTILDADGYKLINFTTSNTNRTCTLPAVANNTDREVIIRKVDSGTGYVLIDTPSSETIDGAANIRLYMQYESVRLYCDGTNWHITGRHYGAPLSYDPNTNAQGTGTMTGLNVLAFRRGEHLRIEARVTLGTVAASEARIGLPLSLTGSYSAEKFVGRWARSSTSATTVKGGNVISVNAANYVAFGLDDYTNTENSFTKQNGNIIFGTGQDVSFYCDVRIAEFAGG